MQEFIKMRSSMRYPKFSPFCLLLPALMGGMAATTLIAASPAARADTAPTKKDAQALYDKLGAALKKKDIKAVEALTTPKTVNITADGTTLARDEWLKSLDTQLKAFTTMNSAVFTITGVKMAGGNMVADGSLHLAATIAAPNGKPHKLDATNKEQDTWTKINGKWLLLIQKDLPGGVTLIDGKPFPPAVPKQ